MPQQLKNKSDQANQTTSPVVETPADVEFDTEPNQEQASSTVAPEPEADPNQPPASVLERDEHGRFLKKKHTHSRRVSQMAQSLGLSQDEIDATAPDQLDDLVYHLNEQRFQLLSQSQMSRQTVPQQQAAPEPEPVEEIDLGLKEEDFNPEVIAAFKKLAKQNSELKKQLGGIEKSNKAQAQRQLDMAIDQAFATLPAEQQEFFGKGRLGKLTPEQLDRRRAAIVVAHGDPAGIHEAVGIIHPIDGHGPSNGQSYVDETLAKRRQDWQNGGIAKPTNRVGAPEPKGIVKAKKTFIKGMRDAGLDDSLEVSEETSELPG